MPLSKFIPVHNVRIPVLHLLLGLGNDLLNQFWKWTDERIEPLTDEELGARNLSLITEVAVDEKEDESKAAKEELSNAVECRKQVDSELCQKKEFQLSKLPERLDGF